MASAVAPIAQTAFSPTDFRKLSVRFVCSSFRLVAAAAGAAVPSDIIDHGERKRSTPEGVVKSGGAAVPSRLTDAAR